MNHSSILPGSISISHLRVYETAAPDGLCGGSPHMHLACQEAYIPLAGRGRVHFFSPAGFQEIPLEPLSLITFSPGMIHRLVNDGGLELLVIMANRGLPESGDAVFPFPSRLLEDPEAYWREASLPGSSLEYIQEAHRRRDLAVEGFCQLHQQFHDEGLPVLEAFYQRTVELLHPKFPAWYTLWSEGVLQDALSTGTAVQVLGQHDISLLNRAAVEYLPFSQETLLGMCGFLKRY